jgi:hypothetical protein
MLTYAQIIPVLQEIPSSLSYMEGSQSLSKSK